MRLAGRSARAAAAADAAHSRPIRRRLYAPAVSGIAAIALFAACRGDTLTNPAGRLAPTSPDATLTGGVGTEIFPTMTPGEYQPSGVAIGLNNAGQVTGSAWLSYAQDDYKPYRWSTATGAQLLTGCCDSMWGNDINDGGAVVGVLQTSAVDGNRAFVATGASTTTLSILPGGATEVSSGAVAINNAGQVAGLSPTSTYGVTHAVLWSATGVIQDLGTLGGSNSQAIDINASGQVIGSSQIAGDAATHFFLWSSGSGMQDLNTTVNGAITSVVEINAGGQIIGTYTTGGASHAFLYTPGTGLRDLGTLGGATSTPTGLNDNGDVVGSSTLSNASTHAFLWTAAEGMEDITALSGVPEVRRLNNNLQTITGTLPPSYTPANARLRPRLVQLQVTQSNAPPTAVIAAECNGLTCVLDGSGSLDDKPGLTFAWDLNKFPGGSATGAKVTVTYPHSGQRTITLTVTDAQGLKNSVSKTLAITDFPIAAFTTSCSGLTCIFDSSPSTNNGAPITERVWSFSDGQIAYNVTAPTITFAQPGTYSVTLEVFGTNFSTEHAVLTKQVTVTGAPPNQPPTAAFTYTCTGQAYPHQCAFDASSSTDDKGIVSYAWQWGNGRSETKTIPTVRNTWAAAGTYNVTLTVKDAGGLTSNVTRSVIVP
jgi:probable HAF family extracellular repeat protein